MYMSLDRLKLNDALTPDELLLVKKGLEAIGESGYLMVKVKIALVDAFPNNPEKHK